MSDVPVILNFAYGSNMLTRRIRERVQSARAIDAGLLRGHVLRWHKVGKDGSGKCDVFESTLPEEQVHGVVYEIAAAEKPQLDMAEGVGYGYAEKQVEVATSIGTVTAWVYYATNVDPSLLPFTWYKVLVVAGAMEHALPADYVSRLESAPAKVDPDHARAKQNVLLAKSP
jgi:gamma-glutamylcyclotransferase